MNDSKLFSQTHTEYTNIVKILYTYQNYTTLVCSMPVSPPLPPHRPLPLIFFFLAFSWREEHEWESRMVDNVCFFSFTFTTNIIVLIDDWVLLANSWVHSWMVGFHSWMVAASPGLGVYSSSTLNTLLCCSNPPAPSLPHKSESSVVGKTS